MIFEYILDLLFPKKCVACNASGSFLCKNCFGKIECFDDVFIKERFKNLSGIFAIAPLKGTIREAIHAFKYEGVKELTKDLAGLTVQHLSVGGMPFIRRRVLLPVPIHRSKLVDRGFNQSELLAKELTRRLGLKIESSVLIKTKATAAQINLKKNERKENVKDVFMVKDASKIKSKKILLVDDVITTGSTLEECAKVLKKAGARDVMGLVVAKD